VKTLKDYLKEESHLIEMTNIGPKLHRFGIDVTLHLLQVGDFKLSHGPRIKILKGKKELFVITLPKDIRDLKIIGDTDELKSKDIKTLINIAKHYKEAFVSFWCNKYMKVDDLLDYIEAINLNKHDVIKELRNEYPITSY